MSARYGFRAPVLTSAHVPVAGWSGRKRVAHLTDLHFGNVTPVRLQRDAVQIANAAEPDLTVLTGDFICRGRRHLELLTEVLAEITGDVIAVLGNHDHWTDGPAVRSALEDAGIEVLQNHWTTHGTGEDALAIVGLDDHGTDNDDAWMATHGLRGPALGLSHNPEAAPDLWGRGVPVVLSGHTHGGQLHVPKWTRALYNSLLKVRYVDGWYAEDGHQLYVNPGVGSSVVPWRAGRPAQRSVTVLELEGSPRVSTRPGRTPG
ncbi:MAG: hypothetical protein GY913_14245 [Proteobacteria bacterium]|nr:hypothetical protein [Pseudomonadota bacterium]MCP4918069.1 hypothetical protein [Pseudomonadota bacterium]